MTNEEPIVSICCLTYNHEPYIRECLEGFLMQKGINFEVLIHDDASTDGTASIVRDYEAKYPTIIKPIFQTENQYSKGVKATFEYNIPRAKGLYIAFCEGDDYWTDPLKLQKQVDFLDQNPDYVMCFTDRYFLDYRAGKIVDEPFYYNKHHKIFTQRNINVNAPTLTRVFRNIDMPKFDNVILNDTVHLTWLANFGKLIYFREKTAVYRYSQKGIWSSLTTTNQIKHRIQSHYYAKQIAKDPITRLRLHLSVSNMALQLWLETYPNPDLKMEGVKIPKHILNIIHLNSYNIVRVYNSFLVRFSRLIYVLFVKYED